MKESFTTLKENIIDNLLCTSCGACKGICPKHVIAFADRENDCVPTLTGECIECGMCYRACVAGGFDFEKLRETQVELQGDKKDSADESYFICHAKDPLIWKNGASGGFVTAALLYALDKGIINHVVVITNDTEKPWLPMPLLAHTKEEIIGAMQSKYCVVPTLEVLSEVKKVKEPVALVTLPCQAQAMMNIRKQFPGMFKNVVLTIGLMCGNSLPFAATKDVLEHIGVNNVEDIIDLKYRDGLWHGDLHVRLKDGSEKGIPYVEYMRYMGDFYRKQRCKMCVDGDAMFSDISSGDGWLPFKKQDNVYGWSIVHTHTEVGENLFKRMQTDGILDIVKISERDALQMKHMYKRHYSSIPRIEYKRRKGIAVPIYSGLCYPQGIINKKALIKKELVDFGQSVLFAPITRKVLRVVPLSIKSGFLEKLLKFWFKEK